MMFTIKTTDSNTARLVYIFLTDDMGFRKVKLDDCNVVLNNIRIIKDEYQSYITQKRLSISLRQIDNLVKNLQTC